MNSELYYDETLDGSAFDPTQRWLNDTLPLLKQAIADQRAPLQLIAVWFFAFSVGAALVWPSLWAMVALIGLGWLVYKVLDRLLV